jgi:hypothetical protein
MSSENDAVAVQDMDQDLPQPSDSARPAAAAAAAAIRSAMMDSSQHHPLQPI